MAASEPFVVIVEFELLPDVSRDDARALLSDNAVASFENEPGCLRFDVIETRDDAAEFILYELYASESAFAEHLRSRHFREFERTSQHYFGDRNIRLGGLSKEASTEMSSSMNGQNDE